MEATDRVVACWGLWPVFYRKRNEWLGLGFVHGINTWLVGPLMGP